MAQGATQDCIDIDNVVPDPRGQDKIVPDPRGRDIFNE